MKLNKVLGRTTDWSSTMLQPAFAEPSLAVSSETDVAASEVGQRSTVGDRQATTNGSSASRPPVEILGPWLLNKGDYLMLWAIVERMEESFRLAVSSNLGMPELPDRPHLYHVRWRPTLGEMRSAVRARSIRRILWKVRDSIALSLVPRSVLDSNGFVSGHDLQGLLDCSGFAYGDQWHARRIEERTRYYARLKSQGATLVMLPQALGPFEEPSVRDSARAMFEYFDLVYARDDVSRQHVDDLGVSGLDVRAAPDITHLVDGTPPEDPDAWSSRVCVVPNARMLDRTDPGISRRYVDFLQHCIQRLHDDGFAPFLLLHERNDRDLAREIQEGLDAPITVVDEGPLVSKGILGACYAVLSSRYHALVGSLSQATPVLATSWAHKYNALLEEYRCTECLVSPLEDTAAIDERLELITAPEKHAALRQRLRRRADVQKAKVREMWEHVEETLTT